MYKYSEKDKKILKNRTSEFKYQVERRLNGELTEDEFKPLRLMNGLYLQLHAYMLRVAIPYGELSYIQLKKLGEISKKFDKGYGHFTTRQNIQFNWPKLTDVPEILKELASVEMHAIQTSGNCIRNISCDHLGGINNEEIEDPRPWCEIIRQWSTFHPEFSFLPRKFKIAVTASKKDRAAIEVHDIGLRLIKKNSKVGFEVYVGGGQGRSPFIAKKIKDFLYKKDLLNYLEAILSVYNELGRRDNIYKARIKILVNELGKEKIKCMIEDKYKNFANRKLELNDAQIKKIYNFFKLPIKKSKNSIIPKIDNIEFKQWVRQNVIKHKVKGYSVVMVSLKPPGKPPGDMNAKQMNELSQLSYDYSFGELRVTHEQNMLLPHVENKKIYDLWLKLKKIGLSTPNIGLISDIICCPGMDYCALATARSIPISQKISNSFNNYKQQKKIGDLKIKISGCINACGHHHVGNIGILGLDRNGEESYQITLGGSATENAKIGEIVGPSFPEKELMKALETILKTYKKNKVSEDEDFLKVFNRIGISEFKKDLYDNS
ncbi:MAG: sulfite reductase [Rickettsiales bacterium]|nr:sulfite reductase [Rickettsiales bacterium]|tara:strand:+ start:1981 stop:3621 length:1641 start_codon:yes stop_codon:yes gene_type:complete